MHQKTNASDSLQVSCPATVFGKVEFLATVFVSGDTRRVCQAWHVASEVQVLTPGIRRAEG